MDRGLASPARRRGRRNSPQNFMGDIYTDTFWERAAFLANRPQKWCEKCGVKDGENISKLDQPKRKTIAAVRVALRESGNLSAANLGLFCTRCRRGPREIVVKPELIAKLTHDLFPR